MRKLTVASLTAAAMLSVGAGAALASPGESHHSKGAVASVSRDRTSHDRKLDRSSRDHHSRELSRADSVR
jgi:hypothetical protein